MSSSSTDRNVFCSAAAYVPRPLYRPPQYSDSAATTNIYNSSCQNYAGRPKPWSHLRSSSHQRTHGARLMNSISISSEDYSSQPSLSSPSLAATKRWVVSSGMTRRMREFIPEFKKDREYWQKRFRNNEAAKRSREKRRINDVVMGKRIFELSSENKRLRLELDTIKRHFNLALNVRFDDGLSPKCTVLSYVDSPLACPPEITTINDDTDDDSLRLIRNYQYREYELSRCVESDIDFGKLDCLESCPNATAIEESNENKTSRDYCRLTSVTNIQDELDEFDEMCTSNKLEMYRAASNPLLTHCYSQGREVHNYPKEKLAQEHLPTKNPERLPEARLRDVPQPLLNSLKLSDYSDRVMTSTIPVALPNISTSSLNSCDSAKRRSQSYYNNSGAAYGVEKKARLTFDERNETNHRSSVENLKDSPLSLHTTHNPQCQEFQLPYNRRVGSRLEISHNMALELVNISSEDEEEVKFSLPLSMCSSEAAIPTKEVPLNLSKRYTAATMSLSTLNDLDLQDIERITFNRNNGMFHRNPKPCTLNASLSQSSGASLHSVAPLSLNKSVTALPSIISMTSPISNPRGSLPMPPLSLITAAGPLPTISTLTASHARRHLQAFPLSASRYSESAVNDSNHRIETSKLEDMSENGLDVGGILGDLRGGEVMNRHVRGGVPLKVWHKLSSSVFDSEKQSEIPPSAKFIQPSAVSEKSLVGSSVCEQQKFVTNESIASSSMVDGMRYVRNNGVHSNYKDVDAGGGQSQLGIRFGQVRGANQDIFESRHLTTTAPFQLNHNLNHNRGLDSRRAYVPNDFMLTKRSISQ